MAYFTLDQPARVRLAATKGVSVLDRPKPTDEALVAMVLAGVRCIDVRAEGDAFRAAVHVREGEWLPLAEDVPEEVAFAAVLSFVSLVSAIPQHYAPEHDAAERAAAAEVFAAFAFPMSIAA